MKHSLPSLNTARAHASVPTLLRVGLIATALAALLLGVAAHALAGTPAATEALVGHSAPTRLLPTEYAGHLLPGTTALAESQGHPVLLVFFYTLCAHCLNELDTVHALAQTATGQQITIRLIDTPAEQPTSVDLYLERVSTTAPVLLDTHGIAAAQYALHSYPALVLVDPQGKVRNVWLGEVGETTLSTAIAAVAGH